MDYIEQFKRKILHLDELSKKVYGLKAIGKTLAFTNGCFDILHVGHVKYLTQTKSFADYSIVLLNYLIQYFYVLIYSILSFSFIILNKLFVKKQSSNVCS